MPHIKITTHPQPAPDLFLHQHHVGWLHWRCPSFQSSEHMEAAYLAITVTMLDFNPALHLSLCHQKAYGQQIPSHHLFGAIEAMFFSSLPSSSTAATLLFLRLPQSCCRLYGVVVLLLREHSVYLLLINTSTSCSLSHDTDFLNSC